VAQSLPNFAVCAAGTARAACCRSSSTASAKAAGRRGLCRQPHRDPLLTYTGRLEYVHSASILSAGQQPDRKPPTRVACAEQRNHHLSHPWPPDVARPAAETRSETTTPKGGTNNYSGWVSVVKDTILADPADVAAANLVKRWTPFWKTVKQAYGFWRRHAHQPCSPP
jgi:hypothetical protein